MNEAPLFARRAVDLKILDSAQYRCHRTTCFPPSKSTWLHVSNSQFAMLTADAVVDTQHCWLQSQYTLQLTMVHRDEALTAAAAHMDSQKSSPERVSVARYLRAVEAKKACWLLVLSWLSSQSVYLQQRDAPNLSTPAASAACRIELEPVCVAGKAAGEGGAGCGDAGDVRREAAGQLLARGRSCACGGPHTRRYATSISLRVQTGHRSASIALLMHQPWSAGLLSCMVSSSKV